MAKAVKKRNRSVNNVAPIERTILFGKENYTLIIAGLVVVIIGFILMSGGSQDNPDVWNAEEIYSFRRITLAPMVVLAGLGLVIFSIFKTPSSIPQPPASTQTEGDEDIIAE